MQLLALNFLRVFEPAFTTTGGKICGKNVLRNVHLAKTGKILKSFFYQNFKQVVQTAIYMSKIAVRGNLFLEEIIKKSNWVKKL